ncbi:agmatinase 1 [Venturia nashicola]|uniref:Agmatinase 1 n=1 Tax=Venturia nashicola TaxID=86259 RepID=A0A4Z1PG86_9PEZI|nr:agmatinase 1 [Venturia nashicola]TLD39386.1 agmatinase 1 [Venturia nashicola]
MPSLSTTTALLASLLVASTIAARDITFPPISPQYGAHEQQYPLLGSAGQIVGDGPLGVMGYGLTTFANLPYVFCLSEKANEDVEKFDVAFLGAGFDTATTGRPGARFGPGGIRLGSRRMHPRGYSVYTGRNSFAEWAEVVDCGDVPLTLLVCDTRESVASAITVDHVQDNTAALKQLDEAHKIISGRLANSSEYSTPRIITLGGDHTTTLSALRSTFTHWGAVSVIHFDSHIDTWDPAVIGGGISHYAGVNHGTFLHIAHEEGLVRNTSIHAGIRAPLIRKKGDLRNDVRCGFDIVRARDIDRIGIDGVIRKLKKRVAGTKVYISVDIDVLDPAFAPATGTSEVGGWTTRELLSILDGLGGIEVIGADVVEVAPIYDNPGETTVLAAAEVAHSLLTLMVETPAKSST